MRQRGRAQWAVKPLAAIEDSARRPSSESADDSVHAAMVRKEQSDPTPTASMPFSRATVSRP